MNKEHLAAQLICRTWPFPRGAGRIIDKFLSSIRFEERIATVPTTDGFNITVAPNDLIGRHIYLSGEFDRTTVEVLLNFSEPGDTILDIGANIGYISACLLHGVPGSRLISIEPQTQLVCLLKKNVSQFDRSRYQIVPVALSDADGDSWIEICPENPGAARLVETETATRITLWSADRLFSECGIEKLDLVKIDVEGHETKVFLGAERRFKSLQPRAICFEDQGRNAALDGPIGSILKTMGYRVFGVRKFLTKVELVLVTTRDDCCFNDYIAISSSRQIPDRAKIRYGLHQ